MKWNKKILIAGGTGFIGKRLVNRLLREGADIYVITRQNLVGDANLHYIKYDLVSNEDFPNIAETFDFGIYMAANIPLKGSPKESYIDAKKSTLDPLIRFCELFLPAVRKFVYISSIDVLGTVDTPEYGEDEKVNAATPYGLAKYCGEFYAKGIAGDCGIPCTILRFSQVYGPGEPIVRIIPVLLDCLVNGREFSLYTTGNEERRFLYVDDAVQAILLSCCSEETGIFNIAGEDIISINDLIAAMEDVFGMKLKIKRLNVSNGSSNVPSIHKAQKLLSYKPQFGILEGLRKVREHNEQL